MRLVAPGAVRDASKTESDGPRRWAYRLCVEVDDEGVTVACDGAANCVLAVRPRIDRFFEGFMTKLRSGAA